LRQPLFGQRRRRRRRLAGQHEVEREKHLVDLVYGELVVCVHGAGNGGINGACGHAHVVAAVSGDVKLQPFRVITGLGLNGLEIERKEERVWNCNSSTFCLSLRELRNPAFSLEKALSSGANRVNPPELEVTSCEFSWFISCVVFRSRVRTENLFAFLRIWTMSMVGPLGMMLGVGAPLGVTGTRGTVLNPGAGAVAGGDGSAGDGGEDRVEGVGVVDRKEVINWSLLGSMLRASRIQWDLHKVDNYEYEMVAAAASRATPKDTKVVPGVLTKLMAAELELKYPAFSSEKAPSSGARIVNPPFFEVTSCAFTWLMIWVVFSNRISVLNDLAFLKIFTMSWLPEESGPDKGDWGNAGTNGFAGAGAGVTGAGFAGAGFAGA
ncbi:NAD(P)H-quinone oxidoreductase subunit H, chloroplastic, partial [Mucuna pruriens]